jgi:hypothetical protein
MRVFDSQYKIKQKEKANWFKKVPQITYVLYLCNAVKDEVGIEEITGQAILTYPRDFTFRQDKKNIPDMSLILMTLLEAKKKEWAYVKGNWYEGWKLTRRGLYFAKDIERRIKNKKRI